MIVFISGSWPDTSRGYSIANLSTLSFFSEMGYTSIYVGPSEEKLNSQMEKKFKNVQFLGVDLTRESKGVRFLKSLFSSKSAISVRFWKAAHLLPERLRSAGLVDTNEVIFFYEDIPAAYLLKQLKREFSLANHIVRSHNVVYKGFQGMTNTGNFLMKWAWKLELKKIYDHEKEVFGLADRFYAISEDDAEWYRERMQIKPDGIIGFYLDEIFFQSVPISGSQPNLLYLGSADLRKGQALNRFIKECWPLVRPAVPDATFILGGMGTETVHDPSNGIIGLGYVDSADEVLQKGNIFINPQQVGAGIKIKSLIALASSRLLISTPVGVEGTGLKDGVHCIVAENVDEMAEEIIRYLRNPDEQLRIVDRGKKFVEEEFSKERFFESMENYFPQ